MKPLEILDNFYFVERGYLNGNHFVYSGNEPVLIDTAYKSGFNETERLIKEAGIGIADVRLIINTHSHCDHIGGNRKIQEISGCNIAMHHVGKHFIDKGDDWSTWWRYYNQEADFFNCTTPLADGDIIEIGPYEFQLIYTPGHASDGIVLYEKRNRVLISSDTLWERDNPAITTRIEGSRAVMDMLESLERISSLDVEVVLPGHGSPFTDYMEALKRGKKTYTAYHENREKMGLDLLKKIIIYTLLMKKMIDKDDLFSHLMGTYWFRENVDLYFNSEYENIYSKILADFLKRGIIVLENGKYLTTVKP